MPTGISYLDEVWNVTSGCTKTAQGCANCYASDLHGMRHEALKRGAKLPECYAKPFGEIVLHEDRLSKPLHLRKPRVIGVCFMSDLFHEDVPLLFFQKVYTVIMECERRRLGHTFVMLTKRAERMRELIQPVCPLRNLWIGVSVSNQDDADRNIPQLLQTPAAHRWVSYEPALGPVDWKSPLFPDDVFKRGSLISGSPSIPSEVFAKIDLIIMGGESGKNARPMHPDWARSVRDQCSVAGVAFYFKQWFDLNSVYRRMPNNAELVNCLQAGCSATERNGGRLLDGVLHDDLPWRIIQP